MSLAGDPDLSPGLWLGFVCDNEDPEGLGRVTFCVPALMGNIILPWARPLGTLWGGGVRNADGTVEPQGVFAVPPINASIGIFFVGGDLSFPYYIAGWFSDTPDGDVTETPSSPNQTSPKGSPKAVLFETTKWRMLFDDDDGTPLFRLERKGSEETVIEINGDREDITLRSKPAGGQESCVVIDGDSGTITIDGDTEILLGAGAAEKLLKGSTFLTLYNAHTHPETGATTGTPVVPMVDLTHLSQKTKTE